MTIYLKSGTKIITTSFIKLGDNNWRYLNSITKRYTDIDIENISAIHDK